MRFLLMDGAGPHIVDGKVYRAGQVVTSDSRLDKLLKNKFLFLDDKPKTAKPQKRRKKVRKAKRA